MPGFMVRGSYFILFYFPTFRSAVHDDGTPTNTNIFSHTPTTYAAIYILGTVIPALLPTVFVVSVGVSQKRLSAKRISCTYAEGIIIAGKVNAAFFDKTGTLTKQGIDFIAFDGLTDEATERSTLGAAVCHTLHPSKDGGFIGNNVDQCAFAFTGAKLIQTTDARTIEYKGKPYKVLKQFEFDSHSQTQSVVVEDGSGKKQVFCKGSPECIRALCATGVPDNFEGTLRKASKSGIYALAIAFKDCHFDDEIRREEVERDLEFGAFLQFQNKMREETPGVIRELVEGNVSVAMITGDSCLTGVCIAREAGMISGGKTVLFGQKDNASGEIEWSNVDTDEIAKTAPSLDILTSPNNNIELVVTGEAFAALLQDHPKYAKAIAKSIRVFGRCNPTDKVRVVTHFVEAGHKTLMTGDGQNDCGSLKAAHVGIALSTAEASVVAPFTSLDKTITSVVDVLREGRCALASAFAAYSYYIIFGQIESYLQTINAYFAITFTEWCWVFMDGIWSTTMAFTLPLAKSAPKLSPTRPTASLLGPRTLFSICGMLILNLLFLIIGLAVLFNEDWFQCRIWNSDDVADVKAIGDNYETTVLFLIGGMQYISSAIALNFGYTWRENFWKNYVFVALAITFTVFQYVVCLHPSAFSCIWRVNCENEVRALVSVFCCHFVLPISRAWSYFFIFIPTNNYRMLCAGSLRRIPWPLPILGTRL